jgi:hypothetical protein
MITYLNTLKLEKYYCVFSSRLHEANILLVLEHFVRDLCLVPDDKSCSDYSAQQISERSVHYSPINR